MFTLPRFDSFNESGNETKETKDEDWHQRITLPLPPAVMDFYDKYRAGLTDGATTMAKKENEHIFSAIADLIRSLNIDTKEFIDYLLDAKDLVRCQPTDEP